MRIAVLMLSYERYDTLKRVLEHNMANAGYPFDLFVWDNGSKDERIFDLIGYYKPERFYRLNENRGIAGPLNTMLSITFSMGYEAFHVMANDILEPNNWLADKINMIQALQTPHVPLHDAKLLGSPNHDIVKSGMVSIAPGVHNYPEVRPCFTLPPFPPNHGVLKYYPGDVIGQFMITRQVYERVGGFREDFGQYGPIDNDYNARCKAMGFVNYYIPGQSQHIDNSPADLYGYNKAELVAKTWPIHEANVKRYNDNPESAYIPVSGDNIVNMKQFWDGEDTGVAE